MPATGHPAAPLRQGRGVTGSDVFPQTCTAHRSHYTDWNNRIEYHGFAAVGSIYKTAFHGPGGGQSDSGCAVRRMALAPTHGSEDCCPDSICQRRKHVGGGLACTAHGAAARLHTGRGLLIQQKTGRNCIFRPVFYYSYRGQRIKPIFL